MVKKMLSILLLLLMSNSAFPQMFFPNMSEGEGCMLTGCYCLVWPLMFSRVDINIMEAGFNITLDCPYVKQRFLGAKNDFLQMSFIGMVKWGLIDFFVDILLGFSFDLYPFAGVLDDDGDRTMNVHARAYVGSFMLNNVTLRAESGFDFDFSTDELFGVCLTIDFFGQGCWPVMAFIPDDAWFVNTYGLSLSFCFTFHGNL